MPNLAAPLQGQDGLIADVLRYGAEACLAIAAILLVDDANSAPDENPFDYEAPDGRSDPCPVKSARARDSHLK